MLNCPERPDPAPEVRLGQTNGGNPDGSPFCSHKHVQDRHHPVHGTCIRRHRRGHGVRGRPRLRLPGGQQRAWLYRQRLQRIQLRAGPARSGSDSSGSSGPTTADPATLATTTAGPAPSGPDNSGPGNAGDDCPVDEPGLPGRPGRQQQPRQRPQQQRWVRQPRPPAPGTVVLGAQASAPTPGRYPLSRPPSTPG